MTVLLPLMLPGLLAGWILVFASTSASFVTQAIIGGARNVYVPQLIYREVGTLFDWPLASAIAVVLLLSTGAFLLALATAVASQEAVEPCLRSSGERLPDCPLSAVRLRVRRRSASSISSARSSSPSRLSFTAGQTLQVSAGGLFAALVRGACSIPSASATEHIAALNSLKIAGLAVLGALLFAVPAAVGMAQASGAGPPALLEPLLLLPLVLPSLVYGLAALIVANLVGLQPSLLADGRRACRRVRSPDVPGHRRRRAGARSLAGGSLDHRWAPPGSRRCAG